MTTWGSGPYCAQRSRPVTAPRGGDRPADARLRRAVRAVHCPRRATIRDEYVPASNRGKRSGGRGSSPHRSVCAGSFSRMTRLLLAALRLREGTCSDASRARGAAAVGQDLRCVRGHTGARNARTGALRHGGSTSFPARVRCTLGASLSRVKTQCPLLPTGEGAHRFHGRLPRGADRRVVHGQFFPARAKKKPTVAAASDCSGDRAATTLTKLSSSIPPKITARTKIR